MWRFLGQRRWVVIRHVKNTAVIEVLSLHWTEESAQRTALREWRRTGAIFPNPYHAKEIGDAKA